LDELLLSLPPEYALVAFEMAAKQGCPVPDDLVAIVEERAEALRREELDALEADEEFRRQEKAEQRRQIREMLERKEAQRQAAVEKTAELAGSGASDAGKREGKYPSMKLR
jgi:type IV secretory pathway VirB10-like protein